MPFLGPQLQSGDIIILGDFLLSNSSYDANLTQSIISKDLREFVTYSNLKSVNNIPNYNQRTLDLVKSVDVTQRKGTFSPQASKHQVRTEEIFLEGGGG